MSRPFKSRNSIILLIFSSCLLGFLATFFQNCSGETAEEKVDIKESYIGSTLCRSCHTTAYDDWFGSHHDLSMQEADEKTVLGDFSGVDFTSNGLTSRFFKKDGRFFVHTEGGDGTFQDFEVKYTFGVEPLQQYLISFPGGRLQCLPTAWDTKQNKWFDLVPDERQRPDDWLHWSKGSMTWNTMCADCHSTYVEKNYDEATDSYHTQWSIIDVSCEACHGPGKAHAAYVNSATFQKGEKVPGSFLQLTSGLNNQQQVEACARCHARRGPLTNVFDYTGGFMDHYTPDILSPALYHADGQILDEVYVYGSFLQSKMYHNDVRCTNCHNPHSLKPVKVGNDLCTQCHIKEDFDTQQHHFHVAGTEGAQCINCHMPGKYYMGNDFRRDHSFRIPRPDLSARYGTPNACTQCHEDKSADWAAKAVEKWFGPDRPAHFSEALVAFRSGDLSVLPDLIKMVGDTSQPKIVQATAVQILSEVSDEQASQKVIDALKNSSPLIRYTAVNSMAIYTAEDRLRYLTPLLKDSVRAIRTQAAYQLADVNESLFPGDDKAAFQQAKKEFENALSIQADFPTGQLMRGQYYHKMGALEKAARAYREALRQDPYLPQAYFNLANLYYSQGNLPEAQKQFEQVIRLDSNAFDAYYSLGLLLAEMQNMTAAETNLGQAARLSGYPRYYYNWGLALQNLNQPEKAESAFQQGLAIDPQSEDILYALAILYLQQEKPAAAQPILRQLLQINPRNQNYQSLLNRINVGN